MRELPGLCGRDQRTIDDRLDEELPNIELSDDFITATFNNTLNQQIVNGSLGLK